MSTGPAAASARPSLIAISVLARNRSGLVEMLARVAQEAGCNIMDTRMATLGQEFAMFMLVSGSWDAIVKLEDSLDRMRSREKLGITCHRTEARAEREELMPYAIEVVATDRPGIVCEIGEFFGARNIAIEDMSSYSYPAAHTGTRMFSLHMSISVPVDTSIAALRGDFLEFCDQLNIDSIMEPVK